MSEIKVIALTGGPCAGKSTGLAYLRQKLEELGCAVIITQEAPTDLMVRGLTAKQASTLFFSARGRRANDL
jgi:thymidylate kinase